MDIPRQTKSRTQVLLRVLVISLGLGLIASAAYGLIRLRPAIRQLDRQRIVLGTVTRGNMVRQVRGSGRLIPEKVEQITAETGGRVKAIHVKPGMPMTEETILIELENPSVEKNLMDARLFLQATESALTEFLVNLEQTNLDLKAARFQAAANYSESKLQAEIDNELWKNGLISQRQHRLSTARSIQALELRDIQLERVRLSQQTTEEKLAVQKQRVEVARYSVKLAEDAVKSLQVRAGVKGVVQQVGPSPRLSFEIGQQVSSSTLLAVVTTNDQLKAELQIPQAQAQEVVVGQPVMIESVSSRDEIPGRVIRIDPSVQGGTVLVEAEFLADLPRGARPDLSIYGTIEIERLENVLYVNRPPYVQAGMTTTIFRLTDGGQKALRTAVRFGASSLSTIVVDHGLTEGDEVILSDLSSWRDADELLIK